MTNRKTTRRALFSSVMALLLCFTMLLGTTFAWFTDSASTGINTIQAGNLDIVVSYATQGDVIDGAIPDTAWKALDETSHVFNPDALWEPGYTEVVYFKINNAGSLALKYKMSANIAKEVPGTNVEGDEFKLSEYLSAYYMTGNTATVFTKRTNAQTVDGWASMIPDLAPATLAEAVIAETSSAKALSYETSLESGETAYTTMVIFMPTTVGNEANHNGDKEKLPSINLGINIVATQYTSESDSFGDQYDKDAFFADYYVYTADELIEALGEAGDNKIVAMMNNIKIDPASMSNAYGKTGINIINGQVLDGGDNTLDIKGANSTWDSGINITGGTIKNLTVTGAFRGIFINHNSSHSEKVILENVVIDDTTYTISCDQGTNQNLMATNCTINGWTSYAATIGEVEFIYCSFGEGRGYAFCRPYAPTAFVGCDFAEGYEIDPRAAVTFEDCTINGIPLTADNLATLVTSNIANASVK